MNQEFILVKLQKGEVHFNNQREAKLISIPWLRGRPTACHQANPWR